MMVAVADFVIVAMVLVMVVDITVAGMVEVVDIVGGDGYSSDGGGNYG